MNELIKQLTKLLNIKNIIALILVFIFAYMQVAQINISTEFNNIMLIIIGFFFGSAYSNAKEGGKK